MERATIRLGRSAWPTLEHGAQGEWLETNGLGGWAYGTVVNMQTRFYHAVLAAALQPPTERMVLLAKLDETLLIDSTPHPLYANRWASGHVHSEGLLRLHSFALDPFPTWTYIAGDVTVTKRLFMRHGQNTTVVRYHVQRAAGKGPTALLIDPLVTCRTIHGVHYHNDWPFAQELLTPSSVTVEAYVGAPRLYLAASGGAYERAGEWVNDLYYPYEELRGEHTQEDLYRPGRFRWTVEGAGELTLVASTEPVEALEGARCEQEERDRRERLVGLSGVPDPFGRALVLAADQFIVQRKSTGKATVIAGYPWFTDWGRDTMIALPGLTLTTRRYTLARELLQTFAAYERDGLIPNCFPEEGGQPLYNTADASLWFFEAVWQYLRHTGEDDFVRTDLWPVLIRIATRHIAGTLFDIRVTPDGLLRCGNPGVQVTWMDAKVGDWVVTPRDGKPVEIQALWYNALRILADLCDRFGAFDQASGWRRRAKQAAASFDRLFWNEAEGCCFDRLADDGTPDPAIRPNQVFTMTLTHPILTGERAQRTVDLLFRELYTPYGLRSLSPRDPAYKGVYVGTRQERDAAYHQGTVWAWLLPPFLRAYLAAYGRPPEAVSRARRLLEPMRAHLSEYGLGSIAENFDGDLPHHPRACVAQAWSVAEALRLWTELRQA
jgi:predicted glycogen debranching enzyme